MHPQPGAWIRAHGGKPEMWNTGHALVKAKLKETGAPLAGEMSGHMFLQGALVRLRRRPLRRRPPARDPVPRRRQRRCSRRCPTPSHAGTEHQDARRRTLRAGRKLKAEARFEGCRRREVITIDGVRVEYADGFGLARASNTTPVVVLRFEADNAAALLGGTACTCRESLHQ
jgi:phosphomannomutase/phosphoglucomutase